MDLPTAPIRLTSPAKVRAARHRIRRLAAPLVGDEAAYSVEVMASEAISNALIHGHGTASVTVVCDEKVLRVEVRDEGPGFAVAARTDHGRGLAIVDALADRWAMVRDGDSGTCVFFEVDR